ncbi:6-pyruvoyl tetrahydropterin synthase [Candidatus Koribacter versatilis Ellin345]|uniref:6-carboxy-5,6,7,8-tetrahydropterin synthase n=1 Tax=Koribacter versatilis (strain Ellin345) TaxID=204669 RepID=Q1IPJ0_KORVE|nr:6-carboxytetrahydropterin synthase [Candidatus Koribacter versatilis]ABF41210.1 6-pyruvoyl tetrahydropterin synthase [Candidatus Koribacter versatilis Ellin345]
MKAHLTRRYWFVASHRLHTPRLSEAENREVYGKCNNPFGHGHNYALEVTVGGQVAPDTGMVYNLADVDRVVRKHILERYDHQNLNCLKEFQELVPTTENLCLAIFEILKRNLAEIHLDKVRLEETSQNSFEVVNE